MDGRLDLMNNSIELRSTRLWYAANHPTYGKDTYGFSGSAYMTLDGGRGFADDKGNVVSQEPANYAELSLGTREKPGIVYADGEVRRVDVAVSIKRFTLFGLEFRLLNAGLIYEANKGTTTKNWGFYGVLATELGLKKGSFSGGQITTALGTRDNPGVIVTSKWDEKTGSFVSEREPRDIELRFANFKLGTFFINQLEISYKIPDKTKPNVAFWAARAEIGFSGFYGGISLKFKSVQDTTTGITDTYFDGATVVIGSDPTGISDGIPIGTSGAFLIRLEGGVENWTDPDNWAILASATIGWGKRLPWFDSSTKDVRKCYPVVVRGTVRVFPAITKITGTVDVFVGAYWDKMAFASNQEGWKPLIGNGKGTFIIDVPNYIYKVEFKGSMYQLIHGELQFLLKNGELLFYANIQLKPTPYGIWDFWPVNKIDASSSVFLLLAEKQKLFSAWTRIRILGINQTLGFGYDFLKSEVFWIMSDNKVNELLKLKDAFLNGSDPSGFNYIQKHQAVADSGSTSIHSSRYTVTIPFVTADVPTGINGVLYASALTSDDIRVQIPTTPGNGVNALPAGTSFTSRVVLGTPGEITLPSGKYNYRSGSIIVDIFPNPDGKTDLMRTFRELGIDKLMVDIQVGLKKNSMFFLPGQDDSTVRAYLTKILQDPAVYLNGIDKNLQGAAQFEKAVWDTGKNVTVEG
ncbi:MAG: hypothetical protein ACKOS8_02870, partial [Gemmataceae bacterium]